MELQQLQWNMSYWNEKDGRLSFETQLKIKFVPANNPSKTNARKNPLALILFSRIFVISIDLNSIDPYC